MIDVVTRLLEPVSRRIALLVSRGVIRLTKDGGAGNQRLQADLLAGETRDDLERVQEYGFTSRPKSGAEAVVIFPGGSREFGLVIAVDDRRYRLKSLQEGEVALYTDEGDRIHMKRGGLIEIQAASKVVVNSPAVELGTGTLEKALAGETFQSFFNSHTHTSTSPGSPTSPPTSPMTAGQLSSKVKVAT
jgi:phage baseplate assembly protein V